MAHRPEFVEFDVDGTTLAALRWSGIVGAPTVVAVHGITSNAWVWDPFVHRLAGAAEVIALDLRGRGRSFDRPGPFGIRRHADDVISIIDQFGGPVTLVGHSMGAFVVELVDERRPDLVRDLLLVDGGIPLERPEAGDADAALEELLGPGLRRIRTVWPDRVSYHAMWASHPAFGDGIGPDLERNLLADLIEVDGGFRAAVDEEAVLQDGRDMLCDDVIRTLLDRRATPTTIVRAELGILGTPPAFITQTVRDRYPEHHWVEARGRNHSSVLNSPAGAGLVADTLRDILTS